MSARGGSKGARSVGPHVILTTFTDPMMGLSWEMEPVYRKLETHCGESVSFRYRMGLLVADVMRLVDPRDLPLGKDEAIRRYDDRLAQTYLDEEAIGGVPIVMDGFHLFSAEGSSTLRLCLAYGAARAMDPTRADEFLYALRYATIVETRPTTKVDEILRVARNVGLDDAELGRRMGGKEAKDALEEDLGLMRRLGIQGLPAILLSCGGRGLLLNGLAGYEEICAAMARITDDGLAPHEIAATPEALGSLLDRHPLISAPEVREAFDLPTYEAARDLAEPLVATGAARIAPVKRSWFLLRT